jgi:CheY-like chemotaxis protein
MNTISDSSSGEINIGIQILVVEDDDILALNIQEILEVLGYTNIYIVSFAELAIKKAHELRPHLILMDIQLPGKINGIQAAEQIWDNLQIPSVYFTGYINKVTLEMITKNYPFTYLIKPVSKQKIDNAIRKTLENSLKFKEK